ncbi:4Fe-4S single cluster domain-containing protein [Hyphomicrobium sp. 99]|uniref:4Fe-4S single cluster domain-containing protein n=1 Tax=Hyphomicrobium sp. 99 TaxID=1163419 RepID=UPI0018CE958B|nr:4Fe-4S single cluster domain-containing protein [Hyphomicrobium sp. 99]
MIEIALSRLHFPVTTLGPGKRIGIWLQGCSIRCPGCISADTWAAGRHTTTIGEVMGALQKWLRIADGITVSGGEPFDQSLALVTLLKAIRGEFSGDIFVYSGYPFEKLHSELSAADGLIDALMTDPFVAGMAQSLPLRGSDNQRLHLLTSLGADRFAPFTVPSSYAPKFDVMFDEDGSVWFAGVPSQNAFRQIAASLDLEGHRVSTSEDKGPSSKGVAP